jgi:hypothetical protein
LTTSTSRSKHLAEVAAQPLERLCGTDILITCRDGTSQAVTVGKLSIDQLVALAKFGRQVRQALSGAVADVASLMAQDEDGTAAGRTKKAADEERQRRLLIRVGLNVVDNLIVTLDAEEVGALVGIVIDRDAMWCRRNVGAEDIARIVEAIVANNDIGSVIAAFRRAVGTARPTPESLTEPADPPSATSPSTATANGTFGPTH